MEILSLKRPIDTKTNQIKASGNGTVVKRSTSDHEVKGSN
jgi:hypothetical protein